MKTILLLSLLTLAASAATLPPINLIWDPNPETNIVEYRVYVGRGPRSYDTISSAGLATRFSITNPAPATIYYIAVTAVNEWGLESDYSNEVRYTTPEGPSAPSGLDATMEKPTWTGTTNRTSGAVTPQLRIPGDPGVKVTARIESPGGTVTRTGTIGTNRLVTLAGRPAAPPFTARATLTAATWTPQISAEAEFR